MGWKVFNELTVGIGFGTFTSLFVVIVIKGIPEWIAVLKENNPKTKKTS
jgi:rRNA maturation protein Rpf1